MKKPRKKGVSLFIAGFSTGLEILFNPTRIQVSKSLHSDVLFNDTEPKSEQDGLIEDAVNLNNDWKAIMGDTIVAFDAMKHKYGEICNP